MTVPQNVFIVLMHVFIWFGYNYDNYGSLLLSFYYGWVRLDTI